MTTATGTRPGVEQPAGPAARHRTLKAGQFGLALASAVFLMALWEIGKVIARRQTSTTLGGRSVA